MQVPDHFEPALFAACLDKMGETMRLEARAKGPGPESHSLNVFATELHKLAVAMDGLSLRRARSAPGVDARPTDGNLT